jgi:hypothetical protein
MADSRTKSTSARILAFHMLGIVVESYSRDACNDSATFRHVHWLRNLGVPISPRKRRVTGLLVRVVPRGVGPLPR